MVNGFRYFLWATLIAGLLYVTSGYAWESGPSSPESIVGTLAENTFKVVRVDDHERGGTGFFVRRSNGALAGITNAHICKSEPYMHLLIADKVHQVRIIQRDENLDLCQFFTPKNINLLYKGLPLSRKVKLGQTATVYGFQYLLHANPSHGYVASKEVVEMPYEPKGKVCHDGSKPIETLSAFGVVLMCYKELPVYMTTLRIFPGNSGSPIADAYGKIIGIATISNTATQYGGMIGVEHIRKFLREK